jgi:hypothetical protein
MKAWFSTLILAIALQGGCRKATFKNIEDSAKVPKSANINTGTGGSGVEDDPIPPPVVKKVLIVSVPVAELPFGKTTQATATLKDGTKEPVIWTVKPPQGKDGGTITEGGIVTPPKTGTEPIEIEVIAVLKSDPKITGKVPLKLIPSNEKPQLIVTVPVPEIKIGGNTTTAVASLKDGTLNPPVKWSIMAPAMGDGGKIDENTGVYTSPATGSESFVVLIIATLIADPTVTGSTNLKVVPVNPLDAGLIVTTPSPEIRSGGKEMLATARLKDGTLNPPVKWTLIAPPGVTEYGTIDEKGLYRSPSKAEKDIPLQIVATLLANEAIKASVPLTVLKDDQIFARCTKANVVFPIVADVYKLPLGNERLPTDWKQHSFQTTVCMENYNVPERDFTQGFPDLPGLFEDFGMTTRTSIVIPNDGIYVFQILSDDGAKMWIDNTLIIDLDGTHQAIKSGEVGIQLKAGKHSLVLDYYQGPRYSIALVLYWKKPGDTNFSVVPRSSFE